jgi:transcriptional regulator with XRE-family HTH domain
MTSRPRPVPRTRIERDAARLAGEISRRIGEQVRTAREDAGLSLTRVALAGGLSKSRLHDIEAGRCQPRWETLARVSAVLGLRLGVGLYPDSGPLIREHVQAVMLTALLAAAHQRWRRRPEVAVYRPVRGVIDMVLDDDVEALAVACEAQSELRRPEQQLRWSHAKADALATAREEQGHPRSVSRLLLLRSTLRTRTVVATYADLFAAAYPAHAIDAYAALTEERPWPGDAILWCRVEGHRATVLDRPPRVSASAAEMGPVAR